MERMKVQRVTGHFTAELAVRARAALDWLLRAQAVTGTGGCAHSYSPVRGWAAPYPETSGYIIPTLYAGSARFRDPKYSLAADRMAAWLLELQHDDGWFPALLWHPRRIPRPSVFNTGQIVFGLVAAAERHPNANYAAAARRAIEWLVSELGPDARWHRHAYRPGYIPSYYTHICWPMAEYQTRLAPDDASLKDSILQALAALLRDRNENGTFSKWAFAAGKPAPTHTIAYTLQGMLEAARVLGCDDPYGEAARASLRRLMVIAEVRKRIAGAYDTAWRGVNWYRCATGHCQLASAWLTAYRLEGDPRFLNVAVKAVHEVAGRQTIEGGRAVVRGAIPGSIPLWGRYMPGRYPNWAAKFFADAAMDLEQTLSELMPASHRA